MGSFGVERAGTGGERMRPRPIAAPTTSGTIRCSTPPRRRRSGASTASASRHRGRRLCLILLLLAASALLGPPSALAQAVCAETEGPWGPGPVISDQPDESGWTSESREPSDSPYVTQQRSRLWTRISLSGEGCLWTKDAPRVTETQVRIRLLVQPEAETPAPVDCQETAPDWPDWPIAWERPVGSILEGQQRSRTWTNVQYAAHGGAECQFTRPFLPTAEEIETRLRWAVSGFTVTCTVTGVGSRSNDYADGDQRPTVRCDTNGKGLVPRGTKWTAEAKTP